MLSILEMILINDLTYIFIMIILVVIIILTILSIKKDRDKLIQEKYNRIKNEQDKFKIETAVAEMEKKLENGIPKANDYIENQEEEAIISYQDLVRAVKNKNGDSLAHKEVGMEVANTTFMEDIKEDEDIIIPDDNSSSHKDIDDLIISAKDIIDKLDDETLKDDSKELNIPVIKENDNLDHKPYNEKNFQSSEFISPIFGKSIKQDDETNLEDNETNDIDKDEFLDSLKNFRRNM